MLTAQGAAKIWPRGRPIEETTSLRGRRNIMYGAWPQGSKAVEMIMPPGDWRERYGHGRQQHFCLQLDVQLYLFVELYDQYSYLYDMTNTKMYRILYYWSMWWVDRRLHATYGGSNYSVLTKPNPFLLTVRIYFEVFAALLCQSQNRTKIKYKT